MKQIFVHVTALDAIYIGLRPGKSIKIKIF